MALQKRADDVLRALFQQIKGDGYRARALRSTGMTLINIGGQNVLRLASNLILTRLLFPEAFGLMVLVQVVITGANMFSDIGLRDSVLQNPRGEEPAFLNTVWTVQVIRGFLLGIAILIAAGPLAQFYEEPILEQILLVAAFVPVINGFQSTKVLTADRNLQIERVTIMKLITQVVALGATVSLAWWLQSVWALVIGNLVGPLLSTVLSHVVLKGHSNRIGIDKADIGSVMRFGGFIFFATVAGFFSNQGDRLILGKYITLEELALYSIALMLAAFPKRVVASISSRVIHPLYARKPPSENAENRRKLNAARRLITTAAILCAALLALIGDPLVQFLYDDRYSDAGSYLALIALSLLPGMVVQTYNNLPLASGHSGRYAVFLTTMSLVRFGLLLLLVPSFGLLGAILMPPLAVFIMYIPLLVVIAPYKGWDGYHDFVAFGVSALLALGIFWFNPDVFGAILEPLGLIYTQ